MQTKTLWIREEYLQPILDGRNILVFPKDKEPLDVVALEIAPLEKNG